MYVLCFSFDRGSARGKARIVPGEGDERERRVLISMIANDASCVEENANRTSTEQRGVDIP